MSKDRQIKWTDQQTRAILSRGGNVFVTASAGTGKTAVLSGRCVNLISDGAVCPDVLNMLVLTFTDAAAEQMRSRIGKQLREAFHQSRDSRLARQLTLLQGADISTIHSFCKRLITEHFHELSLDPSFRVIDSDEAMLLKAEMLEETIEWAWQQSHLSQSLHELLRGRDLRTNNGFLSSVIQISDFLEGVVAPDAWCERARAMAFLTDSPEAGLGRKQKKLIENRLNAALSRLGWARKLYRKEIPDGDWADRIEAAWVEPVGECLTKLRADDWPGCVERIGAIQSLRKISPKGLSEAVGDVVATLLDGASRTVKGLGDLALVNPDYLEIVGRSTSLQTQVLIELVQKFTRLYAERKRALSGLDFADLERFALQLLAEFPPGGQHKPTETALALRKRYKYIFVDEYQDINPVQQAILDALSSGDNVFVVGDVKQSIYAWRGAEPTIFLEHLVPASVAPKDIAHGFRVDLNYNFRSAKGILDFVNKVFGRIMTADVANIDYDEAARLRPSPQDEPQPPGNERPLVELHILDEKGGSNTDARRDDEEDAEAGEDLGLVHSRQRQAAMIAQRIRQMVGADTGQPEFQVRDAETDSYRRVEYRDIVILMRSLAKKANEYVEILRLSGVPVSCDATAGYFEATEISDVLCLLKVLDNPQRDIELAAVLRGPFFALSDSDLARIRLHDSHPPAVPSFYSCAVRYRQSGPDQTLRSKLDAAFETLSRWRSLARRGDLAGLLWRVYRESSFLAFVCALPNGQARKANLLKLHDRAIQFEGFASNTGIASLTRFVEFIERLQAAGQDWAPAQPGSAAGNAVRILSVHKSKGLEFPVVFLAEIETQFNRRDLYADLVVDTEDAVGLQVVDAQSNTKLQSLAHQVIEEKKQAAGLAEEMRILYVATTRARDRLILTASQKRTDCSRFLATGLLLGEERIPDWLLTSCKNGLEWVLYGLSDQRVLHQAFGTGLSANARDDALLEFRLYRPAELKAFSEHVLDLRARKARGTKATKRNPKPSAEARTLFAQIQERLAWRYPFAQAVSSPAKISVTKLTHPEDAFALRDGPQAMVRLPVALAAPGPGARCDPLSIGTAAHLVIASLDLGQTITLDVIERTKARLVSEHAMAAEVADCVDADRILGFFQSELGSIVLDRGNRVLREWPFTYAQPIGEPGEAAGEFIVVQGVIDMLVQSPQGWIVIDFKTDRVGGNDLAARADVYRAQVDLYARAAGAILKDKVLAGWLYFMTPRQAVQV
ncbi:MAG: helicase-exonuclease AddAB subunit AddA [Sedimentisphaerales bacterium]|nr:helicase-exonuclease AddAB subunit AddA [Sedimentisphaerales bacterium]